MCISVENRRRTAAIASIAFAIVVTIWVLAVPVWNQPVFNWTQGKTVRFDEAAKQWIERQAKSSESLFQAAGVVVAALWGLVIVKEGYAGLAKAKWEEWSTFVCGNYFLLLSLISHAIFNLDLAAAISGPTDTNKGYLLGQAPVWGFFIIQAVSLLLGCMASAATFLMIHLRSD